jgi:hypothetical protein
MTLGLLPSAPHSADDGTPPRDIKKLVLVTGLGILSWVATYVGMLELIEANMGDLPLVHKLIIGFSVAMLMTMIIWLLDQIFSPVGAMTRLFYVAGYVFLSVISVGFGFGFYWKVLESRAESTRSAESAVTSVQTSLNAASTRLEQLNATLLQLATISREKAETERVKGTSCPNSKPGDGPRRKMRDDDAARFSFASDFVSGRVAAVKADMSALDGDLAKIATGDKSTIDLKSGTRNEFMKALSRKLDMTVSGFNALRTDPQLKQLRADLTERAERTTFGDPKSGGFVCPDTQLSQALRGAARAIAELPVLEKPVIAAVEGSEATIEAFRRLTATFYGLLSFKMPPSADELRELQKKAIQQVEGGKPPPEATEGGGLSKRDYVPLAIAIFVDICLLLVSIGRPVHRLHGLVPKMREAERGPVIEILSRFNEIHRDQGIRENFELFRHVVFDVAGAYYVAVPLDAPLHVDAETREALRVEAQLLSNLFTSFEQDRIFRRTWTPFTKTVRSKLRRQGSKFAESEAFRIYRFHDGAWSEIILGAVMGAARRAEAAAERQRIEETLRAPKPMEPTFGPVPPFLTEPPLRTERPTAPAPEPVTRPRPARKGPDAKFVAQFGIHARHAEAEFARADAFLDDEEENVDAPANSNTAPPPCPAERKAEQAPTVIFSPPPKSEGRSTDTATEPTRESIGVILKRETATVNLPLDAVSGVNGTDAGLIGRIGEALDRIEKNERVPSVAAQAIPAARPSNADAPLLLVSAEKDESFEDVEIDIDSDPANADAASIAGRLRPRFAAE